MSSANGAAVPGAIASEVEVMAKATRRRFSAEYKRKILREAEACTQPGEIGALLRREGLYFSNLKTWREQRTRGELAGLAQKKVSEILGIALQRNGEKG
jgi:transposase-like protein